MKKILNLDDIATTIVLAKEQGVDVCREGEMLYFVDPEQIKFEDTLRLKRKYILGDSMEGSSGMG